MTSTLLLPPPEREATSDRSHGRLHSCAVLVDPLASGGGSDFRGLKPVELPVRAHQLLALPNAEAPLQCAVEGYGANNDSIAFVFDHRPLGLQIWIISTLLSVLKRHTVKHVGQIARPYVSRTPRLAVLRMNKVSRTQPIHALVADTRTGRA